MKYVTTLQILTEEDPRGWSLTDYGGAEARGQAECLRANRPLQENKSAKVVNLTVREGPAALTLLEVTSLGLVGRAVQVRLPNGQTSFLSIPEEEQARVNAILKAAL